MDRLLKKAGERQTLKRPDGKPAIESTMERSSEMKKVDMMTGSYVQCGSYAQHKALNEIYDALPDLADGIAEGYQGACELILDYPEEAPAILTSVDGALEYLRYLSMKTGELQAVMPHTEIVNQLDMVKDAVNSAKYKLLFLS
jgi:hypothetical protein